MESTKSNPRDATGSDLSDQIKAVTRDSHVRAENTQLMLNYQKGQITQTQYKIYQALEEELDRNANHLAVQPIYFPQELARLESLELDLEHFFGPHWRKRITIGKNSPLLLVAHAYTRYLGDLSGGQVLGKITQKSLGLSGNKGVLFFSFPGVSSPNKFKQLYRSRMNSIELTEKQRREVFDDLQKMLSITQEASSEKGNATESKTASNAFSSSPVLQFALGVGITLATVGMGVYAF
ncbi:Heme oxygenase [Labeo rohita]|uniref:Heme oxygenase n=1 Tax=Labeo rohita TaxID=84645 RepID=A0ABQ8MUN6_LABRO|nr:Heme oxygenase [Labeo rohita]